MLPVQPLPCLGCRLVPCLRTGTPQSPAFRRGVKYALSGQPPQTQKNPTTHKQAAAGHRMLHTERKVRIQKEECRCGISSDIELSEHPPSETTRSGDPNSRFSLSSAILIVSLVPVCSFSSLDRIPPSRRPSSPILY